MLGIVIQQLVNAATVGALYALIALGYTMVYGVLRLINFVHSELFMLGAYVCFALLAVLVGDVGAAGALAITVAFFAVFAIVGSIGVTIERVAYKPLRAATRLAPMLSALGLSLAFQAAVQLLAGPQPIQFPRIFPSIRFDVAGAVLNSTQIGIVVLAVILMLLLTAFVGRTRLGVVVRAVSESPRTAALLGINVDHAISLIFFVGPGLGALGGILGGAWPASPWSAVPACHGGSPATPRRVPGSAGRRAASNSGRARRRTSNSPARAARGRRGERARSPTRSLRARPN